MDFDEVFFVLRNEFDWKERENHRITIDMYVYVYITL